MSQRCSLTYTQRFDILKLRHTIRDEATFMAVVQQIHPLSDVSLSKKNLSIWAILVEVALRNNKMNNKRLNETDFSHDDRVALSFFDYRYLNKQSVAVREQVDKLSTLNPKAILKTYTPNVEAILSNYIPNAEIPPKEPENVIFHPYNKKLAWSGIALILGVIVLSFSMLLKV